MWSLKFESSRNDMSWIVPMPSNSYSNLLGLRKIRGIESAFLAKIARGWNLRFNREILEFGYTFESNLILTSLILFYVHIGCGSLQVRKCGGQYLRADFRVMEEWFFSLAIIYNQNFVLYVWIILAALNLTKYKTGGFFFVKEKNQKVTSAFLSVEFFIFSALLQALPM